MFPFFYFYFLLWNAPATNGCSGDIFSGFLLDDTRALLRARELSAHISVCWRKFASKVLLNCSTLRTDSVLWHLLLVARIRALSFDFGNVSNGHRARCELRVQWNAYNGNIASLYLPLNLIYLSENLLKRHSAKLTQAPVQRSQPHPHNTLNRNENAGCHSRVKWILELEADTDTAACQSTNEIHLFRSRRCALISIVVTHTKHKHEMHEEEKINDCVHNVYFMHTFANRANVHAPSDTHLTPMLTQLNGFN